MPRAFLTGGSGFFGGILKRHLLSLVWECVSIDLCADEDRHPHLTAITGDIADPAAMGVIRMLKWMS